MRSTFSPWYLHLHLHLYDARCARTHRHFNPVVRFYCPTESDACCEHVPQTQTVATAVRGWNIAPLKTALNKLGRLPAAETNVSPHFSRQKGSCMCLWKALHGKSANEHLGITTHHPPYRVGKGKSTEPTFETLALSHTLGYEPRQCTHLLEVSSDLLGDSGLRDSDRYYLNA